MDESTSVDKLTSRHCAASAQGANYASEYRAVDRLILATRRRVVAYDDARQKVPAPALISIDLSEIQFE